MNENVKIYEQPESAPVLEDTTELRKQLQTAKELIDYYKDRLAGTRDALGVAQTAEERTRMELREAEAAKDNLDAWHDACMAVVTERAEKAERERDEALAEVARMKRGECAKSCVHNNPERSER